MTQPCNGCDCCLPLDADELCSMCAGSLVHVWVVADHPEPLHAIESEEQDLTEKLSRALVEIEKLRPMVDTLTVRATEGEALAARWEQCANAANRIIDTVVSLITHQRQANGISATDVLAALRADVDTVTKRVADRWGAGLP